MAISKITTRGMSGDTLDAGDIAPNAIGASELADNAVDTAAIADLSVTNAKLPSNIIPVKPHIQYGILQPAVAGKDLSGTALGGSYTYGTAHTDGHSYYYTDIKGSKPIKDPRIGAHFGSQRHKFTSLQLLEQETAAHGKEVHSVDGREWLRTVQDSSKWYVENGSSGVFLNVDSNATGMFIEITGYFNDINLLGQTADDRGNDVDITVNGDSASRVDGATTFDTTTASPLSSRYVSGSSLINLGSKTALGSSTLKAELGSTPAINTVKIEWMATGIYERISGIELIAQDTTSTANKSKIQIPSQNVVSYGKKFTVSGTPHYDPFNGFTSGNLAAVQTLIDTDTSLGLANWLHSGSYYRPYNGGRVVKWVASDGTIKTSVNMMPPNAKSIANSASLTNGTAKANASIANSTFYPSFEAGAIDDSLSEVAKTFHWREFGNGSANAGTGGTYADASMLNTTNDDIAYVMDDGLTSLSADDCLFYHNTGNGMGMGVHSTNDGWYITFIGTGFNVKTPTGTDFKLVQNLPYGTHIVKLLYTGSPDGGTYTVDGVPIVNSNAGADYWTQEYLTFFQPKMPPIPDDAVVISDYMLMADYVPQTAAGIEKISKGVRVCALTRDGFYDSTSGNWNATLHTGYNAGFYITNATTAGSDTDRTIRMPAFATNYSVRGNQMDLRAKLFVGTTDKDSASTRDNSVNDGSYAHLTSDEVLGVQNWGVNVVSGQTAYFSQMELATPIHTSHHYQDIRGNTGFETPFLRELVGGDRNMEQNNLIVTPDGKTWDEVTRKTDYIGKSMYRWHWTTNHYTTSNESAENTHESSGSRPWICRGNIYGWQFEQKNFIPAHNRHICLKNGTYELHCHSYHDTSWGEWHVFVNGTDIGQYSRQPSVDEITSGDFLLHLKRGDYVQVQGGHSASAASHSEYYIKKLD